MIEDVQPDETVKETAAAGPPEEPLKPPRQPRKPRTSPRAASGPANSPPGPEEVIREGPASGLTRSQVLEKYGDEVGHQILEAAAGRVAPFTRDLTGRRDPTTLPEPEESGRTVTGPQQDRGPVHLLPRPLDFMMKPEDFFRYWSMLAPDELSRVKVRPYRLWPVTDVNQLLSPEQLEKVIRKEKRPPTKTLPPGPLKDPFDPNNWMAEVNHRYGAGDYNFILTDTHPAISRTICQTNIIGLLRDMDTYPPVLDQRTLVLKDPANESYIRWCSVKGIKIKGREEEDEEENDMAASTKILAETVTQLARGQQQQNNQPRESTADTIGTVTKMMADASRQNQEALIKSMESQRRAEDPVEFHERVMKTAQTLVPNGSGNLDSVVKLILDSNEKAATAMKEANGTVMQMVLSSQKSLETRLAESEKANRELQTKMLELTIAAHKPPDAAGTPGIPKTPMDMFGEVSKMMTGVMGFVEKLSDRVPRGGADGGSVWSRIADKLVDAAPNIMYNWTLAQQAQASLKGIAPGGQAQAPDRPGEEEEEDHNAPPSEEELAMNFLQQIEQPLIHALTSGATGQEFGALMMKTFGAETYEFIAQQSDDNLFQLLRNSPAIWSTVQKMSQRFIQFLAEFRERDKVQKLFQRMNAMSSTQPQPRTTQAPPPPAPGPVPAPVPEPAASAASAAGGQAPSQVTRRLKPGQRVVHTPSGQMVVDATATVVPPDAPPSPAQAQTPAPPPPPPTADPNPSAATA